MCVASIPIATRSPTTTCSDAPSVAADSSAAANSTSCWPARRPALASAAEIDALLARSVFALPSFSDTGGPFAGSGNRGRIDGPLSGSLAERASLATLYTALMTSEALDALGSRAPIVVDGPFASNDLYCSLLAALRPRQPGLLVALAGRHRRRRRPAGVDGAGGTTAAMSCRPQAATRRPRSAACANISRCGARGRASIDSRPQ